MIVCFDSFQLQNIETDYFAKIEKIDNNSVELILNNPIYCFLSRLR